MVYSSTERPCNDSICGEALHDEERLGEDDRVGCAGAPTSFVAVGVELTFLGVEGETDFPFIPDGAGTPSGQGIRRPARGLFAVLGGVRTDRVLSCELPGVFLGLVSALEVPADFKRRRQSSQWVGSWELTQHTADAPTFMRSNARMALGSHHSTRRKLVWFLLLGELLVALHISHHLYIHLLTAGAPVTPFIDWHHLTTSGCAS